MPKVGVILVVEARLPPHKKGRVARHNRDHPEKMAEEEEPPH